MSSGGGGREPNKPTGVRHAILLTQTAGTSCSQIKHLNFYCAEQPRKNHRKSSLPLPHGPTESLCRVLALKETGSPRQGPHLANVSLSQTLLLPGQGLGVTAAAGQPDTWTHTAGAQPTPPGREYGLELRILHNFLPRFRHRCSRAKALLHYPTQKVFP